MFPNLKRNVLLKFANLNVDNPRQPKDLPNLCLLDFKLSLMPGITAKRLFLDSMEITNY